MTDFVTHTTAATQLVAGDGRRSAYRALGSAVGVPLVLCRRFRGTMDDWDSAPRLWLNRNCVSHPNPSETGSGF
jgi:hypothetical protein